MVGLNRAVDDASEVGWTLAQHLRQHIGTTSRRIVSISRALLSAGRTG